MQSNVVVQLPNGVGEEAEDSGSDVKTRERHGETEFSQHRFTSSRWWPLGCLQYSRLHLTSCRAAVDVAQPAVSNEIQDLSIFANQHQCLVQIKKDISFRALSSNIHQWQSQWCSEVDVFHYQCGTCVATHVHSS